MKLRRRESPAEMWGFFVFLIKHSNKIYCTRACFIEEKWGTELFPCMLYGVNAPMVYDANISILNM